MRQNIFATYKINILSWKSKWLHRGWENSTEEIVGSVKACDNQCIRSNQDVLSELADNTDEARIIEQ